MPPALTAAARCSPLTIFAQASVDAVDIWLGTKVDQGNPAKGRLWCMAEAVGSFSLGALAGAVGFALFVIACIAMPILVLLNLFALLGPETAGKTRGLKAQSSSALVLKSRAGCSEKLVSVWVEVSWASEAEVHHGDDEWPVWVIFGMAAEKSK
ncbi:hypothetical protein AncyloWKF20_18250 [Ancylobacter sp. WKF20]|uniref:hypothetical protein n=1 Tax=Ancylobacter sp. WKF20 TaxID=3039801 RepID=UPI0024341914|nr:hypothetical protein [Ancylobacter sp. WKF20]WGD32494.1 hypothetical protein AncyloWKF20_18250 [Ancylobacter sp. WKF20]